MRKEIFSVVVLLGLCLGLSCRDVGEQPQRPPTFISTDTELFAFVTQRQPFTQHSLFPNADSVTTGTLNGSHAHQPQVRVSMNARALSALVGGQLPSRTTFPDSSVIFKLIRTGGATTLYAVMFKDRNNPLAANGWLWAEYRPNGAVDFSITTKGAGCIGCHAREQGPQNDYVRTFERQRP